MKIEYLNCLKSLRNYRKLLKNTNDSKKGKLYFSWLSFKTEKIKNEKDEYYIYNEVVNKTLKNYKIDKYNYERLNEELKEIINNNYISKDDNYIFSNSNIAFNDAMIIFKKILFKEACPPSLHYY